MTNPTVRHHLDEQTSTRTSGLDVLDSKNSKMNIPNMLNIPETSHLLAVSRPKTPEAVNKIMLQMAVLNERLVAYSGETAMG